MEDSQRPASIDTVFRLLAGEERRQILRRLADTPGETTVGELDDFLRQTGSVRSDGSTDRRRIELRHVHLPKLADVGVIEYDPDERVVGRGPAFAAVVPLLDAADDHW